MPRQPRHTRPTKIWAMGIRLATYRPDHDRSKDIRLATIYHTTRHATSMNIQLATYRPDHDRSKDIRLATIYHTHMPDQGSDNRYSTCHHYPIQIHRTLLDYRIRRMLLDHQTLRNDRVDEQRSEVGRPPTRRTDRKSTRLNSSHSGESRMPSSA